MDYRPAEDIHKMVCLPGGRRASANEGKYRLNTKIESREVAVVDLVKDLSDGVCLKFAPSFLLLRLDTNGIEGPPYPPTRVPLFRITRSLCCKAQTTSPKVRECQFIARLHQIAGHSNDQYRRRGCC